MEGELQLANRIRAAPVLRRRVKGNLVAEMPGEEAQSTLQFVDNADKVKLWEYAVLVTNTDYGLDAYGSVVSGPCRLRDEFLRPRSRSGAGGYTTQGIERCQNSRPGAVALIYNWWSWYVRLAHPQARLEAITSRPMLLSGVALSTRSVTAVTDVDPCRGGPDQIDDRQHPQGS